VQLGKHFSGTLRGLLRFRLILAGLVDVGRHPPGIGFQISILILLCITDAISYAQVRVFKLAVF
jgi:hypothetical protein